MNMNRHMSVEHGGMVVGRVNGSTQRKHAPSATLSTRIPYGPPWDRNWLHAVI